MPHTLFQHTPQVPFDTIAGFRKVKELTSDKEKVRAALEKSTLIATSEEGMLRHIHASRDSSSFVIDSDAALLTEDEVLTLFSAPPKLVNEAGSFVVTFADEEAAKVNKERISGKKLPGHTEILKTYSRITYTLEEEEQQRLHLIAQRKAHLTPTLGSCVRNYEFPAVYRSMLIGRGGSNIKKLTEMFPSLHIDTRSDDVNIVIRAQDEATIDKAVVEISKLMPTSEERRNRATPNSPPLVPLVEEQQKSPLKQPLKDPRVSPPAQRSGSRQGSPMQNPMQMAQTQELKQAMLQQQMQAQAQMEQQQFQVRQAQQMAILRAMSEGRAPAGVPSPTTPHLVMFDLKIPSKNAGLLIGKKGSQKAKLEEHFRGCRIKVTTNEDESDALVNITAPEPTASAAVAHIMKHFGPSDGKGMAPSSLPIPTFTPPHHRHAKPHSTAPWCRCP